MRLDLVGECNASGCLHQSAIIGTEGEGSFQDPEIWLQNHISIMRFPKLRPVMSIFVTLLLSYLLLLFLRFAATDQEPLQQDLEASVHLQKFLIRV
ncbi:hypothetical protein V6N11_058154 [Hibiscus sabdariffa]|uniref:Uncharacterized protein n=1 Tax=Hibiscus sabdariffa TaxID=183260 RepID=A0ABR2NFX9_9ROSI